jgi:hypothetical protein
MGMSSPEPAVGVSVAMRKSPYMAKSWSSLVAS